MQRCEIYREQEEELLKEHAGRGHADFHAWCAVSADADRQERIQRQSRLDQLSLDEIEQSYLTSVSAECDSSDQVQQRALTVLPELTEKWRLSPWCQTRRTLSNRWQPSTNLSPEQRTQLRAKNLVIHTTKRNTRTQELTITPAIGEASSSTCRASAWVGPVCQALRPKLIVPTWKLGRRKLTFF